MSEPLVFFLPPWRYPHRQITRPSPFNAIETFDERIDDSDDEDTAVVVLEESVRAQSTSDVSTADIERKDSAPLPTTSEENGGGGGDDSSGHSTDGKIDPFGSFTWKVPKVVKRIHEVAMQYTTQGGIGYSQLRLHNATWCGFGPALRPRVWAVRMSHVIADRLELRALVRSRGVAYADYSQIIMDIGRTYSPLELASPPRLSVIRQPERIYQLMLAMASYNQSIGYGQGMNRLAIVLVDVFAEQWQQFWALDYLLTRIIPHYFTRRDTIGTIVDIALLGYYIRMRDAKLADALLKLDDPNTMIDNSVLFTLCSKWWTSLFVGCMQYGCVVRLWDSIILDGAHTLFNFTYRILQSNREEIMHAADGAHLIRFLFEWLEKVETLDEFARIKLEHPIELSDVEARRAAHLNALLTARPGDTLYLRNFPNSRIDGYSNCGRGCVCESVTIANHRKESSRSVSTPALVLQRLVSAQPAATVGPTRVVPTSSSAASKPTTSKSTFIGDVRPLVSSVRRSIDESLFISTVRRRNVNGDDDDDDDDDRPLYSFTTDNMPLAAPLRSISTVTTRHVKRGTKVASSNKTNGSTVPAVADGSNGRDG